MSSASPAQRHRPGVVTAAVVIQVIIAVLVIVTAIMQAIYAGDVAEAMRAELERQDIALVEIDQYVGSGSNTINLIIMILLAVGYIVLALLNARGSRASRIITWIVSGIALVCNLIIAGFASMNFGDIEGVNVDIDAMFRAATDAVPGWYNAVSTVSTIAMAVGLIAVIVLLALPAAHPFFRKQEPPVVLPPEAMNP